jgi:hypothetical protein
MSTVQIYYDGNEIAQESVLFRSVWFESQLGAQPGQFEMTIKDPNQTLSFVTGKHVRLVIDGQALFGGFVFQVSKRFAFLADDTVTAGAAGVKTRMWRLRGVDYNILFDKRFLYNVATPRQIIPKASGDLQDGQVVQLLTSNYLDLADDDIDLTTKVFNVGDPTPTGGSYGFNSVGAPWRKEMLAVSAHSGAIWYIGPGSTTKMILYYRGREVSTPAWGFSDTPNSVTTFGFRELEFTEDASNLVNDALVWGGNPYGVTGTTATLTFGRAQDTTSITDFFRSQRGEQKFGDEGYITDNACEVRANVIVWGRADADPNPGATGEDSADPNRGLRVPQKFLRLVWFGDDVPTVLIPGSVVTVDLNTFGDEATLPVRSIRIRFESPTIVRYEGYLGIQTDDPFSLWRYMNQVIEKGGTTGSLLTPVSDGSSPATVAGTEVCMIPTQVSGVLYSVTDAYQGGSTRVWVNGLRWRPGIEYAESDPLNGQFQFFDALLTGDNVWVCYTTSGF